MNGRLLDGLVVLVVGVGAGMGRSVAVRAAAPGASVVPAARTAARLCDVRDEIVAAGGQAYIVPTDMPSIAGLPLNACSNCCSILQYVLLNASCAMRIALPSG